MDKYKNLNELFEDVKKFTIKFHSSHYAFFRGANKESYGLTPSLFRNIDKIADGYKLETLENNLFYEFTSNADKFINDKNNWQILYQMQHYGIPTRLLDWTESFGIALFFALEFSDDINEPCIWVLDPYKLNELETTDFITSKGYNLFNPNYHFKKGYYESFIELCKDKKQNQEVFSMPKALYPVKSNDRIRAQKGVFTIHGKEIQPLEKIVTDNNILKKFVISNGIIEEAKSFLKQAGIDFFTIYPDFEGISRYVKKYYYKK